MQREVFLSVKEKSLNPKKMHAEIENNKRMLLYIESFEAFCENNEVFDLNKRRVIIKSRRLLDVYNGGVEKNVSLSIIGKN